MNDLKETIVKSLKPFVCGLIASTALFGGITAANALSYKKSIIYTDSANGISYEAYNQITTGINSYGSNFAAALTQINSTNVSFLAPKSCGVKPRLYNADSKMISEGDWHYSIYDSTGVGADTSRTGIDISTSYYSKGLIAMWNGASNYDIKLTYGTPNLQDFT